MGHPTPSQPLPQPFGRYVLQDLLGEGGFARVYRAELQGPAGFRKTVAIKIMRHLHPERAQEILREGRLGGLIKHRNVVDTYELGMVDEQGFVAMEWVDGLSLKELVLTDRPPPSVVIEIGLGICRGLFYAHSLRSTDGSLGLVHMDLKPANVLVGWDGSVKVADFGIARLTGVAGADPHSSAGTPAYLSPEHASGLTVDARSDLFSLGAVLYEVATGQRLFSAEPLLGPERVAHIDETLSQGLDAADAHLPGLTAVLSACLSPSVDARIPDAQTVAAQLRTLRKTVGTEPSLEVWLADALGEKEQQWVADLEPWHSGSAEETLALTPSNSIEDALADLNSSNALESAIAALHRAEQALQVVSTQEQGRLDKPLRVIMGRAGLEMIVPGNHPYLVLNPEKGGSWSNGSQVANYGVATVMGRLLHNIAVHGSDWSRERLYSEVWEQTYRPPSSDAALRMAVSRLRNQLKGSGVVVEHQGEGRYGLAGRPAVVCWRGEPVAVEGASVVLDPPPTAPPEPALRTNLTPEPNTFVGRGAELAELAQRFSDDTRLVTILGPPGTGKTRFVRRFGALQVDAGDSVWFCDLTEARTAMGVLSAVATALGVPLTGKQTDEEALAERLGHAIAGRGRTWILLDNAEQVAEVVGQWTRTWWERATEARFVVTSRVPLRIEMERRLSLNPLSVPNTGEATEALEDNEAVALFVARAQVVRAGFTLDPEDGENIIAIVRELDGLPLAIELAAARMGLWPAKTLRARLTDRFRLLSRLQASGPQRQATLRGALDWSWELLTPWEQAALAQCSVFRGGFTWEAAEAVIDTSAWPDAPWTVDVLGTLVEHSLVTVRTDVNGESRLSMLVSVRAYGAEKLAESGEEAVHGAEKRHGVYYGGFGTEVYLASLTAHGGMGLRARLYREVENLKAATVRAVAATEPAVAASCWLAWTTMLLNTEPAKNGVALGDAVLGLGVTPEDRAALLMKMGQLKNASGRADEAMEHYNCALDIHRELGDRGMKRGAARFPGRREGKILGNLATLHMEQGRSEVALEHFNRVLDIHREWKDRLGQGIVLGNLGNLHRRQGRMEEALGYFIRALDIHREVGNRRFEGGVLGNLGLVHIEQGQTAVALESLNRALDIAREIGNRRSEGNMHGNLGTLHMKQGRADKALEHFNRALDIHREVGNRWGESWKLAELGHFLARLGDLPTARQHLTRAEQLVREINDPYLLATHLCHRGQVDLLDANPTAARDALTEAEALAADLAVSPTAVVGKELQALRDAIANKTTPDTT